MIAALLLAGLPNPLLGPTIQIDPGFAYYADRSAESIAREIEVNGFKVVRYVVTDDRAIDDKLIAAFHSRGMAVWYATFSNGFYGEPAGLPNGWESWKAKFMKPSGQEYTFLSLSSEPYRAWKAQRVVDTAREHAFDGVEFVESFQMNWGGPEAGDYGDFSEPALAAFRKATGETAPPEFADAASARFWKTDSKLYRKWVDARAAAVSGFLSEICAKVRAAGVKKPICVWALANTPPKPEQDPVALEREWQGIDAGDIAVKAKPDLICFQTNWPDWSTASLPADYPKRYTAFAAQLRKASKVPFIVQADIGSWESNRRSREWMAGFDKACREIGAVGWTAYSYDIALWFYTEAPEVKQVEAKPGEVLLVFQKRLDKASAEDASHYVFSPAARIGGVACDGNLVRIRLTGLKKGAKLTIDAVKDDMSRFLVKNVPQHACRQTVAIHP